MPRRVHAVSNVDVDAREPVNVADCTLGEITWPFYQPPSFALPQQFEREPFGIDLGCEHVVSCGQLQTRRTPLQAQFLT